ncbi:ABC transporter ATP-binding protein [Bacillus spongiae]|uniref:ABC transporter ATP-binding protein n=1 Tax=Bacillus spongiae TaxID=2683610 RepID=A0ABU8HES0_9BACI
MVLKSLTYSYRTVWKASKFLLFIILLLKIGLGFVPLLNIWLFEKLFDSIATSVSNNTMDTVVFIYLFGLAFTSFLTFVLYRLTDILKKIMSYKFEVYSKRYIFLQSRNVPYIEYENPEFQNSYYRVFSGQQNMLNVVDSSLTIIQSSISLVTVMWYLLHIDILFILLLIIMVLPLYIIEVKNGKQRYELMRKLTEIGRMNGYLENLLIRRESLKGIRINNLETYFVDKWEKNFVKSSKEKVRLDIKQTKWLFLSNIVLVFSYLASGGYVYYLMYKELLTIGVLAAVLQAIQTLQGIVPNLTGNISTFYESALHVKEFQGFSPKYERKTVEKRSLPIIESIEAKGLSFTYPNNVQETIRNIDLSLQRGKKIAVIGNNGSGKTTLIKCLIGLYETSKMVEINHSYHLEELNQEDFRANISVLFQDFNKYDFSIKENISISNVEDLNLDKMVYYATKTGINDHIQMLPDKYDTILGRSFGNSKDFSGGQWQKLALSRAMFKETDFLFLDEPTSAMDPESEFQIINNLLNEMEDVGVVYITHRINVAMLADEILLMEDGEIKERGSHEELVSKKGQYFKLYNRQLDYLARKEGGVPVG